MSINQKMPSVVSKSRTNSFGKIQGKTVGLYILISLVVAILAVILPLLEPKTPAAEAVFETTSSEQNQDSKASQLPTVQETALLAIPNPIVSPDNTVLIEQMGVVVTAYSSSTWETDDTPHLTAAGTMVRDGIVANNLLPFGTKIRLPEIYGDKIFVVEDRMNSRKGNYQIDIWFPSYWEAVNFGAKETTIEIVAEI